MIRDSLVSRCITAPESDIMFNFECLRQRLVYRILKEAIPRLGQYTNDAGRRNGNGEDEDGDEYGDEDDDEDGYGDEDDEKSYHAIWRKPGHASQRMSVWFRCIIKLQFANTAKILLKAGADLSFFCDDKEICKDGPLTLVVDEACEYLKTAEILIRYGTDVHALCGKISVGYHLLLQAVSDDDLDLVTTLVMIHGVPLDVKDTGVYIDTPIRAAMTESSNQVIEFLIDCDI